MRGFRSTLILLAVLLGLLGYIYFYELKRPAAGEEPPKQKVFALEADAVEEVEVKSSGGDRTLVRKSGGAWAIAEPQQAKADETELNGIVTNLASLEIQRVVDEAPADIAQYGLAAPKTEVAFRKAGQKDQSRLLIGDKTATGGELYAKLPSEKRVFLIAGFLETTFNRGTFDLRDKTLMKFERDKVDALELASAGATIAFAKKGEHWAVTSPVQARADLTSVEGLVGRLQTLQMKSIVATDVAEKDLGKYGLDKPAYSAVIGVASARATLAVGKADESGALFARDLAQPAVVVTIDASLADDLKKKADDYRPKEVFEFRTFSASRLEVTRGSATVAFEQAKGKDGLTTWKRISPAKDVPSSEMDPVLSAFSGLMVDAYVDAKTKTGMDAPVAVVTARFDDGKKEERVTFGRVGAEVFAARAGEPGAMKLDAARFDEAIKALDALK